ncbi:MAG: helix-turn-helix domain-containing protein [Candidatus Aenigmarchaeota archaeon]|nr:helix-turn-helix domain-containing protein [Candidatus Aenigmarchaeota archaeon]MDI6722821.1 helix-turn-helix domain-containing protein [Candidatus Aenigmarchaeota archaeon]
MLIEKVERVLDRNGFSYCECRGCFDIAARKKSVMFLKVLNNIDSFQESQSRNMRILSREMDAAAMIIGSSTRRETLKDNIIYERFDIPAMNVNTFELVVENETPVLYRRRGGMFVEISSEILRSKRLEAGMTQEELASKAGVTKKNIYEHERARLKMSYETALNIEYILGDGIIEPANLELKSTDHRNKPENSFEAFVFRNLEKIGFDAEIIRQSPFNFIAEDKKFSVISEVDEVPKRIEKNATALKKFSDISGKPIIAISKHHVDADIPSVDEKSFRCMGARDIRKFVKSW